MGSLVHSTLLMLALSIVITLLIVYLDARVPLTLVHVLNLQRSTAHI